MVVIVDFGMGNIHSVYTQCKKIHRKIIVATNAKDIKNSNKLILPGVGHFSRAMEKLDELKFIDILNEKVIHQKTPVLGICLGMQLLGNKSEEGGVRGLGWIDAETIKFDFVNNKYKIPHMGWNNLQKYSSESIFKGIKQDDEFYFVHSYHMKVKSEHKNIIIGETEYGYNFISAVQKDNIFGTQFHPEKSHDSGRKVLKNFLEA